MQSLIVLEIFKDDHESKCQELQKLFQAEWVKWKKKLEGIDILHLENHISRINLQFV